MQTMTTVTATPGQNGMKIQYNRLTDSSGVELTGSVATFVTITPAYGAAGAARLSRAGVEAVLVNAAAAIAALSDTNADLINSTLPGGLALVVSTWEVRIPCLVSGVAALAATLNTTLGTAANVSVLP